MNRRRIFIYSLCVICLAFSVIIKRAVITEKRDKKIISTFFEWQEHGKPVVARVVRKGDVALLTKITVTAVSDRAYEGYVPRVIWEKLACGQDVFRRGNSGEAAGKVVFVSDSIDIDTGLFLIKFMLDDDSSGRPVVYVRTGTLPEAVCVPNDILDKTGDDYLVWVVEDGRARKRVVEIAERNGYGAIIGKGLREGDLLVVQGGTQLFEDDAVNILNISETGGDLK